MSENENINQEEINKDTQTENQANTEGNTVNEEQSKNDTQTNYGNQTDAENQTNTEDETIETEVLEEEKYEDFYQKLRKKVMTWLNSQGGQDHKWASYLIATPDLFYLLVKLVLDKEVKSEDKVKLLFALGYFISPFDLLPEGLLGIVGYLDDIALTAYVLNEFINKTDDTLIKKYWLGEGDILDLIKKIIATTDEMIGSGLYQKLVDKLNKHI